MRDAMWNYIVLAAAFVFEGASFTIALKQFIGQTNGQPFWKALHRSKDPTTYTVLAEDSAALVGLLVAAIGIYASHRFNMPELDGAASVVIGVLLAGVAILLIRESRGLLIGEGIRPETARDIRRLAMSHRGVQGVGEILSMYIGPDDVLVTIDLDFDDGTATDEAATTISTLQREVRERYPMIKRLFIEAGNPPVAGMPGTTSPAEPVGVARADPAAA
jgi:divalent metal cation (Fe/Co/Zn/Cd) transporter